MMRALAAARHFLADLAWWLAVFGRRDEVRVALGNVQEARTTLRAAGLTGDGIAHDVVLDEKAMREDAEIELAKAEELLRDFVNYGDPEAASCQS